MNNVKYRGYIRPKTRRPRKGSVLGPERRNPVVDEFYKEMVRVDEGFRDRLVSELTTAKRDKVGVPTLEKLLGAGEKVFSNVARGTTHLIEMRTYMNIAKAIGYEPCVGHERILVSGTYAGTLIGYVLELEGTLTGYRLTTETKGLIDELKKADDSIAAKVREGKLKDVQRWVRDLLLRNKGRVPMVVLQDYEQRLVRAAHLEGYGVTSDQLRQAFKKANPVPKLYRFESGSTPPGINYALGDRVLHATEGLGRVTATGWTGAAQEPPLEYNIKLVFDEKPGTERRFLVRPAPKNH